MFSVFCFGRGFGVSSKDGITFSTEQAATVGACMQLCLSSFRSLRDANVSITGFWGCML